jgi:hypothetical protein
VGGAELVQQLLVGRGLLERVELLAVQVLQQRVAQHVVVGGLADDGRDRLQPACRPARQPPLAHDELVALAAVVVGQLPHDDGLEQPDLADGHDQLGQRLLVEVGARLQRVGRDAVQRHLGEAGPGDRRATAALPPAAGVTSSPVGRPGGDERARPRPSPRCGAGRSRGAFVCCGSPPGRRRARRSPRGVEVGERPSGPGVVGHHGLTVPRRLGDPDAARDRGREHRVAEVVAHLLADLVGQLGARVVHGEQDGRDVQRRVEVAAHQLDVLEQLAQPSSA